jgi:hypothetical protein
MIDFLQVMKAARLKAKVSFEMLSIQSKQTAASIREQEEGQDFLTLKTFRAYRILCFTTQENREKFDDAFGEYNQQMLKASLLSLKKTKSKSK